MLVRQEHPMARFRHDRIEELESNCSPARPPAVLAERGRMEWRLVQTHVQTPAEQNVLARLSFFLRKKI